MTLLLRAKFALCVLTREGIAAYNPEYGLLHVQSGQKFLELTADLTSERDIQRQSMRQTLSNNMALEDCTKSAVNGATWRRALGVGLAVSHSVGMRKH